MGTYNTVIWSNCNGVIAAGLYWEYEELWDKYPRAVTQLELAALGPVITMAFPKTHKILKKITIIYWIFLYWVQ